MDIEKIDLEVLKVIITNRKYGMDFAVDGSDKILHPDLWRFTKAVLDYIKLYKEVPTKATLIDRAGKNENMAAYIDKTYVRLEAITANEKEFNFNVEKLKTRYQQMVVNRLKSLLERDEGLDKSLFNIQATLNSVKEVGETKVYAQNTLKDGIGDFVERFNYRKANPDMAKGLFTGFSTLDFITEGLKSPEYVLCCGSSGAGKSTLLMSLSVNLYLQNNSIDTDKFHGQGNSVVYYSLEIPYSECYDKLISYLSKIPLKIIKSANLTDDQQKTLNKTLKFIKNYPYEFVIIDIPKGATSSQMESIYADFSQRTGGNKPKVVCIDYLGLVETDDKEIDQDWLRQSSVSEELYKFCRVNDLILLTGVQLNEAAPNKSENQMGVFRLARSKSIVNPSTLCLMLESRPDEPNYPTIPIHIIKNRRGPRGQFTLRKSFETCAFLNDIGFTEENKNPDDISLDLEKFEEEIKEKE